jgi:hypothetical protein
LIKRRRFGTPLAHGSLAGDENGLLASTTNMTRALRSLVPLLKTSIAVSAPERLAELLAKVGL